MSDQNAKNKNRVLFSAIGVVAVLAIVVAVNFIARSVPVAVDFTEDNVHTLSEGTKKVIGKLDTPVSLKFYVTQDADVMPPQLLTRAREVEAFLTDYIRSSDGMLTLQKYDPQPDTDEEDAARLAGVQANPTQRGDIYFGLAVSCLDQKVALPYLPAIPEELLEYEITRAISEAFNPEKAVVGLISSFNVQGGFGGSPFGGRPEPAWIFFNELQRDFEVRVLGSDVEEIEDEIKVLMLLHPAELTDSALYAIDQFVLRGGRLIAFLDAYSITARITQPQPNPLQPQAQPPTPPSSNLEKLLTAWGFKFDSTQVVADLNFKTPLRGGRTAPAVLTLPPEAINQDDIVTSKLNDLWLVFTGAFTGEPMPGISREILLTSSTNSQLVDPMTAENNEEQIVDQFKPSGEEKVLAMRLSGTFETAFPDGKPKAAASDEEDEEDGEEGDDSAADEAGAGDDDAESLKKSSADGIVLLVGDADLLYDQFCVQVQQLLGQRFASPINGNLAFFQNAMEVLSGDSDLIAVRSRASTRRPFTRINEIEEQATASIRGELQTLEDKRREAETKLNEMQAQKDDSQKLVLTPEQQRLIDQFQKEMVDAGKRRRDLQKQARAEVNSLIARIKAINMFAMPLLVAGIGIAVFLVRRVKTAAR